MAYCVGNISGGHFNTAVTLAMLMRQAISAKDAVMYWIFQIIGAFIGTILLAVIFSAGGVTDMTGGYGSNGLAGVNGSFIAGLLVEIILTFIFLMVIQGVTSPKFKHGSFAGLIIGLTLTFVHIVGIGLTGTSVNPARSIAPAFVAGITGNTAPLGSLIVFIIGPLVGAALAAVVYPLLESE
jgi:aquaporin Z